MRYAALVLGFLAWPHFFWTAAIYRRFPLAVIGSLTFCAKGQDIEPFVLFGDRLN